MKRSNKQIEKLERKLKHYNSLKDKQGRKCPKTPSTSTNGRKKYTEGEVLAHLKLKGVEVDMSNKTIHTKNGRLVGNKTLGKIDFLVNYCGYFLKTN